MKYMRQAAPRRRHWPRRVLIICVIGALLVVSATIVVRRVYNNSLRPVNMSQQTQLVTIQNGLSVDQIGALLQKKGLIRSAWAFKLYVSGKEDRDQLQAGTYKLSPSLSIPEIVVQLTHGRIATTLVTILPGQRLDQIRQAFITDGFSAASVDAALKPAQYEHDSALVDKPAGNSLEGYLYPDSFEKNDSTTPTEIVQESIGEMGDHLSPSLRAAFAAQGLSTYQGIILASIVEREVSSDSDRQQAAQVFLARIKQNMMLGSDVTAYYGSHLAGLPDSTTYDSPYNTLLHLGLPPTPISNVSQNSLNAVAHPANTDWLYFVTGDSGVTYFSKTLADHQALTAQYCHKLCSQ